MQQQKSIYLASDLHFGAPNAAESLIREQHFVRWLTHIQDDASALYLLGDVFDFWFEYRHAVPRGYVRLLGKLAEMADAGIEIHVFTGNHDHWYHDYLPSQIGATLYREAVVKEWFGRTYYLAHGDGLGPGDHGYKFMKKIVTAPISQWLFSRIHPNSGIGLALWVSQSGGNHNYSSNEDLEHLGDQEFLYQHAQTVRKERDDIDCFIFGHRHILIDDLRDDGLHLIMLGDWIQYFSYLKVNEAGEELAVFPFPEHHSTLNK